MKTEVKTMYRCDHCNKIYQVQGACERHETKCSKNPENDRACFRCTHSTNKTVEIESGVDINQYSEHETDYNNIGVVLPYCKKLKVCLLPPKAEHNNNKYETVGVENKPMPKECEHQNDPNRHVSFMNA